ncbi:response regulator transcription factor [Leptolyngbya sp. DQ-M1]|uniref:two-component system response regulator RppA n=1 Tax=Leptolyngbya sp. DQ-M1 TaxID=2933920 RepID=UPI0032979531
MRVLLVEDEPDLGTAIHRVLSREKYVVDWVQDGSTAWAYLDNSDVHYTLAILDWMLPGLSGVELCKRLRCQNNPLPILLLTARDRMEDKVAGLDAGADDYLVKPFGMAELLARLRALQRRSPELHPKQLQVGSLILDYGAHTVCWQTLDGYQIPISLTAKEFQTLEYFMRHPSQVVTSHQIMNQLWEVGAEPTSNAVAAQIRLLRRKLAEAGCDGLIETIHGIGYRFNVPHASK